MWDKADNLVEAHLILCYRLLVLTISLQIYLHLLKKSGWIKPSLKLPDKHLPG
jgi:hypothetical protein